MCTCTNSHPCIYAQYPNVHVYTYDTLWTYDPSPEQQRQPPHSHINDRGRTWHLRWDELCPPKFIFKS